MPPRRGPTGRTCAPVGATAPLAQRTAPSLAVGAHALRIDAHDQEEVGGHHRVGEFVDGEGAGRIADDIAHPRPAVFDVITAEECTADTAHTDARQ